jgi:tryptophan 2,3-dioxygenase
MSERLEAMLRLVLMNQIEIMAGLEDLLGEAPATEDDHEHRAEMRTSLNEAIEQTLAHLKPDQGSDPH